MPIFACVATKRRLWFTASLVSRPFGGALCGGWSGNTRTHDAAAPARSSSVVSRVCRGAAGPSWCNLAFPRTGRHPAVCISWNDATAYVSWLSRRTGMDHRLPSAAEWEYAGRTGTNIPWYWGNTAEVQRQYANGTDEATAPEFARTTRPGVRTASLRSHAPPVLVRGRHRLALGRFVLRVEKCGQPLDPILDFFMARMSKRGPAGIR